MLRGEGERREAAAGRRRVMIYGALFATGLLAGLYVGGSDPAPLFDREARWNPAVSLVLVAFLIVATTAGNLALRGSMDEVQRQARYKAAAFAGTAYLIAYPVWFILWKGRFVAEPEHGPIFILFWLCLAGASLWYRFR
jgi:hypothetical protein